jgi:hypothetical protein
VFALKLNRAKLSEILIDSIRRKYWIDGGFPQKIPIMRVSTISKPYRVRSGNPTFTIWIESPAAHSANTPLTRALCRRRWRALVFA